MVFADSKSAHSASTRNLQATGSCSGRSRSGERPFDRCYQARAARTAIAEIGRDAAAMWHQIRTNGSVRDRLVGVGVLGPGDAGCLGTCGPVARASGVAQDARAQSPLLWYPEFAIARLDDPTGDVAARVEIRARELASCCAMLDELLSMPIIPGKIALDGPGATSVSAWLKARAAKRSPHSSTMPAS